MYNVSVSGADLSPLNATTNETKYCPELTLCLQYTITVTPFSTFPDYVGMSTTITNTTSGGSNKVLYSTQHLFLILENITKSYWLVFTPLKNTEAILV